MARNDGGWVQINERRTEEGGTVAVYSDITELKRAELRAEEANQAKSRFLRSVSHDLRTPLNAIINYLDPVLERAKDNLSARHYKNLENCAINCDQLLVLINDILDYTRSETVHPTQFRPEILAEECLRTIAPLFDADRIRLVRDFEAELPVLFTDEDKLRRILLNLLSNAVKFTERGTVTVRVSSYEAHVGFEVADTGVGIPDDQLENIFEEFEQVDYPRDTRLKGTGLGLAICRRFSDLISARLSVESRLERGSTFTLMIPVHEPPETRSAP